MNKPASELIALADDPQIVAAAQRAIMKHPFFVGSATLAFGLARTAMIAAANQSGSERAGVDALREALKPFADAVYSDNGDVTLSTHYIKTADYLRARNVYRALTTPPAQPAPASESSTSSDGGVEGHAPKRREPENADVRERAGIKPGPSDLMNDDQIKYMVDRFLMWKLPEHFNPDCGISFDPKYRDAHSPIGTNLFDAMQADAMVRYMLDGIPTHGKPDGAVREAITYLRNLEEYMMEHDIDMRMGDQRPPSCVADDLEAALHSPKIAAAETSPGDVVAMKEACKRVAAEYKPQYSMPAHEILVMVETRTAIAAAIDRLDVKAEAKSQEPAVASTRSNATNGDELADRIERAAKDAPEGEGIVFDLYPEDQATVIAALRVAKSQEAVTVQERKWKQPVKTVADLVNNLMTIDQTMDVHTAYFITHGDGRKEARTRSPSLSRERVANSRINSGDEAVPYSLVIWTSQDERAHPTTKPEAPAVSVDEIYRAIRDAAMSLPPSDFGSHRAIEAATTAIAALIAGGR